MLGWSEGQQQIESQQRLAFPHAGPSRASYASMIGLMQDCDVGIGIPNKLLPMQTLSTGEQATVPWWGEREPSSEQVLGAVQDLLTGWCFREPESWSCHAHLPWLSGSCGTATSSVSLLEGGVVSFRSCGTLSHC